MNLNFKERVCVCVWVCVCMSDGTVDFLGFFPPKHLSTSLLFFICVYRQKNTSHISQHLTIGR